MSNRVSDIRQALFTTTTYEIDDQVGALLLEFAAIAFFAGYKAHSWLAGMLAMSVLVFLNRYKFMRFAFSISAVAFWTFVGFGIGGLDGGAISIFCAVIAFSLGFLFHAGGIIIDTEPANYVIYSNNDKNPSDGRCWSTDSEGNTMWVGYGWQNNNSTSEGK